MLLCAVSDNAASYRAHKQYLPRCFPAAYQQLTLWGPRLDTIADSCVPEQDD
jgi:hypothetical protein